MTVTIEIKGVKLTVEEARAAYRELHKLFGTQEVKQPSIFDKIVGPSGPGKPYPPYDPRVGEWLDPVGSGAQPKVWINEITCKS